MATQSAIGEERDARRLTLLYELGCAFAARTDLDELVALVVDKCRDVLDAEGASVLLHDPETDELYFPYVAAATEGAAAQLASTRIPASEGVAGEVLSTGLPIVIDDAESDPRVYRAIDRRTGSTTKSMITVPLAAHGGTVGVLQVVNHRGGAGFPADALPFLTSLAGSVAIALENARLLAAARASEQRLRVEVGALRRDLARRDRFSEIAGTSPAMTEVFRLMESAAATPITVLVEGETGTGKELVARALHRASARADGPFVAVNCAALPESLLESELFGHRRGSFTGALSDRVGLFEAARGGTVFLDEVGEMPPVMQAKLLRVLQEGEVVPVGDNRPRKVDVRVISATNRDLASEVATQRFRQDLYYRLSPFPIRLPPLRERREDVAVIATRMLAAVATRYKKKVGGLSHEALEKLERHDWPGNVRELQNEIERAVALVSAGGEIGPEHLSPRLSGEAVPGPGPVAGFTVGSGSGGPLGPAGGDRIASGAVKADGGPPLPPGELRAARAAWEAAFVRDCLRAAGGNVTRAARQMGLSRVALQKKMKEYGLREN